MIFGLFLITSVLSAINAQYGGGPGGGYAGAGPGASYGAGPGGAQPQYGGGPGAGYGGGGPGGRMGGGGMQQQGGMQQGGMQQGGPPGGGMGGGAPGGGQPGIPKTAPCLTPTPQEDANMTGILHGRWYIQKLYFDLMENKPEVAGLCLFIEFLTGDEMTFGTVHQGVFKNVSGTITNRGVGETSFTMIVPGNPPASLPMKMTIIEQDGENAFFYSCGGTQGLNLHVGVAVSRQKTVDNTYLTKIDPKAKTLAFKTEGMTITNQNCPAS